MHFKFEIGEKVKGKKVNAYTVKFENDIVWLFDESDIRRVDE